jgi:hypothetical protein
MLQYLVICVLDRRGGSQYEGQRQVDGLEDGLGHSFAEDTVRISIISRVIRKIIENRPGLDTLDTESSPLGGGFFRYLLVVLRKMMLIYLLRNNFT